MRFARHTNRFLCRLLAGMFLLVQLMVAAHACPAVAAVAGEAQAQAAADMPPDCDQMKRGQVGNLCSEHCKTGQHSADTAPTPPLLAAAPALLYALPALEVAGGFGTAHAVDAAQPAAPPPPHAILHCVLRI